MRSLEQQVKEANEAAAASQAKGEEALDLARAAAQAGAGAGSGGGPSNPELVARLGGLERKLGRVQQDMTSRVAALGLDLSSLAYNVQGRPVDVMDGGRCWSPTESAPVHRTARLRWMWAITRARALARLRVRHGGVPSPPPSSLTAP